MCGWTSNRLKYCEKIEPQDNLGALVKLTNQIWVQESAKTIKLQINYTHNVNRNKIISDCLTMKIVIMRYILHHRSFVRLWKPIVSIQVKIAKMASNPPKWANHVPNHPKMPRIAKLTWMMCFGWIITPWTMWVWKIGWFRLSMQH